MYFIIPFVPVVDYSHTTPLIVNGGKGSVLSQEVSGELVSFVTCVTECVW